MSNRDTHDDFHRDQLSTMFEVTQKKAMILPRHRQNRHECPVRRAPIADGIAARLPAAGNDTGHFYHRACRCWGQLVGGHTGRGLRNIGP